MSKLRVIIIAGGKIEKCDRILSYFNENVFVIAVNGGVQNALEIGVSPDMIIGDLDSVSGKILFDFREKGVPVKSFPPQKNKSDLEIAIDNAVGMDPNEIIIMGATGKRIDHTLFNIFLLLKYKDIMIRIITGSEEIFLCKKCQEINSPGGTTVSLIPLTPVVEGVTLDGFEYPLYGEDLYMNNSRGLSNILVDSPGRIQFKSGELLVVITTGISGA